MYYTAARETGFIVVKVTQSCVGSVSISARDTETLLPLDGHPITNKAWLLAYSDNGADG